MKIGELAQMTQCTVETIRYYEKEGLLPAPARTAGNFRVHGPEHFERLRFIHNCRALDMSHDEIHRLLALADQAAERCGARVTNIGQAPHMNSRGSPPNRPKSTFALGASS